MLRLFLYIKSCWKDKFYISSFILFVGMSISPIGQIIGLIIANLLLKNKIVYFSQGLIKVLMYISFVSFLTIGFTFQEYSKYIQQILVISLLVGQYMSFFRKYRFFSRSLLLSYLDFCVVICFYSILNMHGGRATPWGCESGVLGGFIVPALAYLIFNNKIINLRFFIIALCGFLIASPTLNLIFAITVGFKLLFYSKKSFCKIALFSMMCCVFYLSGNFNVLNETTELSQERNEKLGSETIDNIVVLFKDGKFDKQSMNESTSAFLANAKVAIEAPSRLFGTGLGSHQYSYIDYWGVFGLNCEDAYSTLVRLYSEFGVIGLIAIFMFLKKNCNTKNEVNNSILLGLIYYLLRGGQYVLIGFILFIFWYYYSSKKIIVKKVL